MTKEIIKYPEQAAILEESQKKAIYKETPKEYIKQRTGRGNTVFNYVETGYMIKRLNEIFNHMWEFEVLDERILTNAKEVVVRGQLTVYPAKDFKLVKVQYGGAIIKTTKDGKPLSIADDLKAASSDALKKCASLLGIASDIYWGGEVEEDVNTITLEKTLDNTETKTLDYMTDPQKKKIFALYKQKGLTGDAMKQLLKMKYKIDSHSLLTKSQASEWIEFIDNFSPRPEPEEETTDYLETLGDLDDY